VFVVWGRGVKEAALASNDPHLHAFSTASISWIGRVLLRALGRRTIRFCRIRFSHFSTMSDTEFAAAMDAFWQGAVTYMKPRGTRPIL
jgi:hypothetical protein